MYSFSISNTHNVNEGLNFLRTQKKTKDGIILEMKKSINPMVAPPYLIVNDNVVLCSHVVGYVVVYYQPKQPVEQGQVNLLIQLLKGSLHHHITLSLTGVPHVLEVIDT